MSTGSEEGDGVAVNNRYQKSPRLSVGNHAEQGHQNYSNECA